MYKATIEGNQNILDMFDKLHFVDEKIERALYEAGKETVQLVKQRIASGRNTNGDLMETKSNTRIGRYSIMQGERRQKRGLRTDLINLRFDGNMLDDFRVLNSYRTSCSIGFTSDKELEKADSNEILFGKIFDVEDEIIDKEIQKIDKAVLETIQ